MSSAVRLVVPPEIKKTINPYSGYINIDSKFTKKNVKGLFYTEENIRYLANELFALITNRDYIVDNLLPAAADSCIGAHSDLDVALDHEAEPSYRMDADQPPDGGYQDRADLLAKMFRGSWYLLRDSILQIMDSFQLPFPDELTVDNPVQQLHTVNLDFLTKTAKSIITTPNMLAPEYFQVNPDTGALENNVEWDYSAESYTDGTWHPEYLFSQSKRNKENPLWTPYSIEFNYNNLGIHTTHGAVWQQYASGLYDPKYSLLFPRWQDSVESSLFDFPYASQSFREGGNSDRRVQRPSGYNMASLQQRSTY